MRCAESEVSLAMPVGEFLKARLVGQERISVFVRRLLFQQQSPNAEPQCQFRLGALPDLPSTLAIKHA
jgi:hypothetical protein